MTNIFDKGRPVNHMIILIIDCLMAKCHLTSREKGWYDEHRDDGTFIALMHGELSEALEAIRHDNPQDKHLSSFDNLTVELADTLIRIFDFAEYKKLNLAEALLAKMEFNDSREYKHGGKKI